MPISLAAEAGSYTPASWMTIWLFPCLRISGSETPSLSIRFRMMSIERFRSSAVSVWPFGGFVETEGGLLVGGRARDHEQRDPGEGRDDERDQREVSAPV